MKVILLKDVSSLGRKFDIKDVKSGYALNHLIPRGEVAQATPATLKRYRAEKEKHDSEQKVHADLLAKNIADLDGITLKVVGKANEKGNLFAGLHREAIVAELQKQTELQIDPSHIILEQPIKQLGEYKIEVKSEVKFARFTLVIEAQK